MADIKASLRRVTTWAGRTSDERTENLSVVAKAASPFAAAAIANVFSTGVVGPLLAGLAVGVAFLIYNRLRRRQRSPTGGPSQAWALIASEHGDLVVRSSETGSISVSRAGSGGPHDVEAPGTSLALSADATLAASMSNSTLRFGAIDPLLGTVGSWSSPKLVSVPACRVVAVGNKGDEAAWCAVTGEDSSYRAQIANGPEIDWRLLHLDGGARLGETIGGAFLGSDLWVLARDRHVYRCGLKGVAQRQVLPASTNVVAMDAAIACGRVVLAVANADSDSGSNHELMVYELVLPGSPELIHRSTLASAVDLVRIARAPLIDQEHLSVITIFGSKRHTHQVRMTAASVPPGAG